MNESETTFAILDRTQGIAELPAESGDDFPLAAWYRDVRDTPLDQLTVEDL